MVNDLLHQIRDLISLDIGNRGYARDPNNNLIIRTSGDFEVACRSIAEHPAPKVGIVTGFMIPSVEPPTGETDGPPGSIFLAEALDGLGIPVRLASDASGLRALQIGIYSRKLTDRITIHDLSKGTSANWTDGLTHLIALERSGPNYEIVNRTMRGTDITSLTSPAHWFFEKPQPYVTIGIGDGGNEIGMGKIPREVIAQNIPNGDQVACMIATDHLIVCGISNWGGYALAAGVMRLRQQVRSELFDANRERLLLELLVKHAPLVDGVTGKFTPTVDGIEYGRYFEPIQKIRELLAH